MGDFVPAKAANPYARMRFWQAVTRCVPEAWQALIEIDGDAAQLQTWATRWGLTDSWAMDFARRHLPLWRDHPDVVGVAMIGTVVSWEPVFPAGPSWNPINETEASFRARVEAYVSSMKLAPGITATPEKRSADEHFEWLALHHVGGWTYERIAERYQNAAGNPTAAAVGHAVTDTAAIVGLTLRDARGRKSSQTRHT